MGGGQHCLLGLAMQPVTYQAITGNYNQRSAHTPLAAAVPVNAASVEVPSYIEHHVVQVDQWRQMLNT